MHSPVLLHAGVVGVECGTNVKILMPSNIYGCYLADDVFIGPFVEIQRGVQVGARTRIQSHAFICELVTLGVDCFISHGAKFINDCFEGGGPAKGDRSKWRNTQLGDRVSIGTNATILPVTICNDVVVGAGAVVTRDITEPGVYIGNPAKKLKGY